MEHESIVGFRKSFGRNPINEALNGISLTTLYDLPLKNELLGEWLPKRDDRWLFRGRSF